MEVWWCSGGVVVYWLESLTSDLKFSGSKSGLSNRDVSLDK